MLSDVWVYPGCVLADLSIVASLGGRKIESWNPTYLDDYIAASGPTNDGDQVLRRVVVTLR
jgi:hypothetical protein